MAIFRPWYETRSIEVISRSAGIIYIEASMHGHFSTDTSLYMVQGLLSCFIALAIRMGPWHLVRWRLHGHQVTG